MHLQKPIFELEMKFWLTFFYLFLQIIPLSSAPPQIPKENYVQRIYNSFLLQSVGETRMAYYTFKRAYQDAQQNGESQKRLNTIHSLFLWYRKYGWTLGLSTQPANCAGEFGSSLSLDSVPFNVNNTTETAPFNSNYYLSEWGRNPTQSKHLRNFIFGVAEITVGVFAVTLSTPLGNVIAGVTLYNGFTRCWDSLNNAWEDYELQLLEFKKIEKMAQQNVN